MKLTASAVLLLFLQNSSSAQPQQQNTQAIPFEKGSIEGTVLNMGTGRPVAGAQVALNFSTPQTRTAVPVISADGRIQPLPPFASTTTKMDGSFSFPNLDPGQYRITVTANGYSVQDYGQQFPNGYGTPVDVRSGQSLKDLSIRLSQSGTVIGRILDDSGQPASSVPVHLVQPIFNAQGITFKLVNWTNADDRGQYRLFGVTPGKYYLVAGTIPGQRQTTSPAFPGSRSLPPKTYAVTYYPNAAEWNDASILDIKLAEEVRADLTVKARWAYRIRGRVVDSTTGRAPSAVLIALGHATLNGVGGSYSDEFYNAAAGTFELVNVVPGDYALHVQIRDSRVSESNPINDTALLASVAEERLSSEIKLKITNADIEGIVVTLTKGASVPARVSVDGGGPISELKNFDRIRVRLRPSWNGVLDPFTLAGKNPQQSALGPDGAFRIEGVKPGEYILTVLGIPAGFYVKAARFGADDVLNKPVKVPEQNAAVIDVILGAGLARLTGTVTGAQAQPISGVQAILIPDVQQRKRADLYKTAITNQKGEFSFVDIPPGNYKVFSWEAIEEGGFYNPERMKQFEAQGRAVELAESSSAIVEVTIIPVESVN